MQKASYEVTIADARDSPAASSGTRLTNDVGGGGLTSRLTCHFGTIFRYAPSYVYRI